MWITPLWMWISKLADSLNQGKWDHQHRAIFKAKTSCTSTNPGGEYLLMGEQVIDFANSSFILTARHTHFRANCQHRIGMHRMPVFLGFCYRQRDNQFRENCLAHGGCSRKEGYRSLILTEQLHRTCRHSKCSQALRQQQR